MTMTAPSAIAAARPRPALQAPPALATIPAWHSLLEERWQQRLNALTELALAYHDAAESCARPAAAADTARLENEDPLARLADGSFGRCEQCSESIPTAELLTEPETRYCGKCVAISWVTLAG
jgi:DnaK suppressor protein